MNIGGDFDETLSEPFRSGNFSIKLDKLGRNRHLPMLAESTSKASSCPSSYVKHRQLIEWQHQKHPHSKHSNMWNMTNMTGTSGKHLTVLISKLSNWLEEWDCLKLGQSLFCYQQSFLSFSYVLTLLRSCKKENLNFIAMAAFGPNANPIIQFANMFCLCELARMSSDSCGCSLTHVASVQDMRPRC